RMARACGWQRARRDSDIESARICGDVGEGLRRSAWPGAGMAGRADGGAVPGARELRWLRAPAHRAEPGPDVLRTKNAVAFRSKRSRQLSLHRNSGFVSPESAHRKACH